MLGRLASTVTGGATARPGAGFYLGPARWICPAQSNVAHNLVSVQFSTDGASRQVESLYHQEENEMKESKCMGIMHVEMV